MIFIKFSNGLSHKYGQKIIKKEYIKNKEKFLIKILSEFFPKFSIQNRNY